MSDNNDSKIHIKNRYDQLLLKGKEYDKRRQDQSLASLERQVKECTFKPELNIKRNKSPDSLNFPIKRSILGDITVNNKPTNSVSSMSSYNTNGSLSKKVANINTQGNFSHNNNGNKASNLDVIQSISRVLTQNANKKFNNT